MVFDSVRKGFGGRLRFVVSGGAPLASRVQDYLQIALCCPVLQGYGLTETCVVVRRSVAPSLSTPLTAASGGTSTVLRPRYVLFFGSSALPLVAASRQCRTSLMCRCAASFFTHPPPKRHAGTVGPPLPATEFRFQVSVCLVLVGWEVAVTVPSRRGVSSLLCVLPWAVGQAQVS